MPWLPRRSGTHIAESSTPWNFSGGKVTGTRRIALKMPASLRTPHHVLLLRVSVISGLDAAASGALPPQTVPVEIYEKGTWGPPSAESLVRGYEGWHDPWLPA